MVTHMGMFPRFSRRARWAVPAAGLVVTAGVIAVALMPAAQATPALPARTPAQLLADVAAQSHVPAFTGTVVETASLGLPQLPGMQNPTSLISLLTGSHTVNVWYAGPRQYRIALPGSMSETDLYRSGGTAWLWQSVPDTVTKFVLPPNAPNAPGAPGAPNAPRGLPSVLTPQQAANYVLAAVGPTTRVSVDRNVYVAGQPAYELVLAPKDARSLIGEVRIAIDARNSVPLRVEVFASHAAGPAISVGFASITFAAPSASAVSFTPPSGAKLTTVNVAAGQGTRKDGTGSGAGVTGSGWLTVVKLPSSALTSAPAVGAPGPVDSPVSVNGGSADPGAALQALLGSASTVHGPWGSGRLIRTSVVCVLVTNSTLYAGAVEPSVLYAAAAGH